MGYISLIDGHVDEPHKTNPCDKNCPDRALGCHISCERYKAYREYLDKKSAEIRKENGIYGYKGEKKNKFEKQKRKPIYRGGSQ